LVSSVSLQVILAVALSDWTIVTCCVSEALLDWERGFAQGSRCLVHLYLLLFW